MCVCVYMSIFIDKCLIQNCKIITRTDKENSVPLCGVACVPI